MLQDMGWKFEGRMSIHECEKALEDSGCPIFESAFNFYRYFEGLKLFIGNSNINLSDMDFYEVMNMRSHFDSSDRWFDFDLAETVYTYDHTVEGTLFSAVLEKQIAPLGRMVDRNGDMYILTDKNGGFYYATFGCILKIGTSWIDSINRMIEKNELYQSDEKYVILFNISDFDY